MKNLLLKTLLIAGIATTIIACSKEEEAPKVEEPTLKAKWEVQYDVRINKLNADTTLNDTAFYVANELVYEFANDSVIIASSDSIPFKTLKYKYNNGILTTVELKLVGGNDTTVYKTVQYSLTDLRLVSEEVQGFGTDTVRSYFIINAKRK